MEGIICKKNDERIDLRTACWVLYLCVVHEGNMNGSNVL